MAVDARVDSAPLTLSQHRRAITALAVRGSTVVSGDVDGRIRVVDFALPGASDELMRDRRPAHDKAIVTLGFTSKGQLVSVGIDLQVIRWDVPRRDAFPPVTLQPKGTWTSATIKSASIDPTGEQLGIAIEYSGVPIPTAFGAGREDVGKRTTPAGETQRANQRTRRNVVLRYYLQGGTDVDVETGASSPDRLALSEGGCFAVFTSLEDRQAHLQIRSLVSTEDYDRRPLGGEAAALAVRSDPGFVAVGMKTGEVRTWRAPGLTSADCRLYSTNPLEPTREITLHPARPQPLVGGSAERFAVLPFKVTNLDASVGDSVSDEVYAYLTNQKVTLRSNRLPELMEELRVRAWADRQADDITPAVARDLAKKLVVDKLILGRVTRYGTRTFQVVVWVMDAEGEAGPSVAVRCRFCTEEDLPVAVDSLQKALVTPR